MTQTNDPKTMRALVYDIKPAQWVANKLIGFRWPSVFYSRLGGLRLTRVPVPPLPSPHWVRLRPLLGGICGTDISAIFQRPHPANILQAFSSRPALLGHENVSIVDAVGSSVTTFSPGDRVVVEPSLSCVPRGIEPLCQPCAAGLFALCENFTTGPLPVGSLIGWNSFTGGSWSDYFIAHESQLYRVPDAISNEHAVLIDPIAGALHAVLRYRPQSTERILGTLGGGNIGGSNVSGNNDGPTSTPMTTSQTASSQAASPRANVLIIGAGPLAIGVVMSLRALGDTSRISVLVWSHAEGEMMQSKGADDYICVSSRDGQQQRYSAVADRIGGQVLHARLTHYTLVGGFDVVYDCVGTSQALSDALKYARPRGTVIEVGTSQIGTVDTCPVWFSELNIIGANGRAFERYQGRVLHTYELLMELMLAGKIKLDGLLTHRFRIEQYQEAFATIANKATTGAIKVAFVHDDKND